MGRKGLRDTDEEYLSCRLRVKKVEADIIKAMAEQKRNALGPGVTSVSKAVVLLLRLAFNCLREHTARYASPEALTEKEAIAAGLRLLKKKRKSGGVR